MFLLFFPETSIWGEQAADPGVPTASSAPNGRSHFCSGGAVRLPGLPSPLPLAFSFSISALWLVVFGHPSPATFPPLFSIFIAAVSLLFFDFGHPQREDENSRRKGSRGCARLPKARLPQAPVSSCVQVLGGWPGQVLPPHELCIQGLTMIPGITLQGEPTPGKATAQPCKLLQSED